MSPKILAVTHGTSGLMLAYLLVIVPMLVALMRSRARMSKFLSSPLWAVPMVLIAGLIIAVSSPLLQSLGVASQGYFQWLFGSAVCVVLGYAGGRALASERRSDSSYRRGAVVADAAALSGRKPVRSSTGAHVSDCNSPIRLAGIPIAAEDETKHFKFIGTTGTGKTTAIREMLSAVLARGDRVIVSDPDGGYLKHFYEADRGDVILNPFEPDSMKWDLLSEVANVYDVDQLARSLIPDGDGADRSWIDYARTFFTAVVQEGMANGVKDDGEIYRLLTVASMQELRLLLGNTAAGPFLAEGNDKMFGSVRSVTSSAVSALRYTTAQRAAPFSVRQWVRLGAARRNGGQGGMLFLPYKAGEIAALRSTISAWLRIAIFEAMNRPEGDQRLWFVIDELDALGAIDGLKDALARLRKFGGRCILGFQSISQVSGTHGKAAADTIVENCGNTVILRCSASELGGTSQFASRLIGQREVVHTVRSQTRSARDWLPATTISEHRSIEFAIMASEIERLADLEGFLKLASIPDWLHITLKYVNYPTAVRGRPPAAAIAPGLTAAIPAPAVSAKKSRRRAASKG